MKKLHLLLLSVTLCVFSACHNDIWDAIDGLDSRVTKLEELCKEMNTNITSLQTIVSVLQSNDFITGIVEIKKNGEVIGYTITFGKHDPITIYHGQDGQDGADGKDGQDGSANAPVIGVAQDTDGVYYWTLNGEWLLDDNGNKLPVSGKDGQNGVNGTMPQLKIEEGYWYVSYDNGITWTELGKAIGEDGQDGEKGDKGDTGDSMFQSVTQDENYVYFTLADSTVIKIAKGTKSTNIVQNDAIMAPFSISDSIQIYFSKGNLQYQESTGAWRFAENQMDYIGNNENKEGWIDLFAHGTGENPTSDTSISPFVDWGINKIGNCPPNTWSTLSSNEFSYLLKRKGGQLQGVAYVRDMIGNILLPDNWSLMYFFNNYDDRPIYLTDEQWEILEQNGAVFFPNTGNESTYGVHGKYWVSNEVSYGNSLYYLVYWRTDGLGGGGGFLQYNSTSSSIKAKNSVRLVQKIKKQ